MAEYEQQDLFPELEEQDDSDEGIEYLWENSQADTSQATLDRERQSYIGTDW